MNNDQAESAVNVGIYKDITEWDINDGGLKIVAKRMKGKFRNLKWLGIDSTLYYDSYTIKSNYGWAELLDLIYTINNQFNDIDKVDKKVQLKRTRGKMIKWWVVQGSNLRHPD